jgi:capsid protein
MANISPALKQARIEAEVWKSRATGIKAKYDALETNKLRRKPRTETTPEGAIYDMPKRMLGTNIGRDLERNYSPAKGIIHQFRMNVVGSLGKLQVNSAGGEEATEWFNEVWAKDCDYRDDVHFSTMCQNAVASVLREGDFLSIVDDDLIEDTGKLLTWETDQVCPVTDEVLKQFGKTGLVQDNGILRDKNGKILGYFVTGKRGLSVISSKDDATFWTRENAILPRNPWRLNQGRGVPAIISAAASFLDVYEMLAKELQTAKRAASQYAMVNRVDAVTDWDDPATGPERLPENSGKTAATTAGEGANSTTEPEARNYESLEAFTGGYTDYGDPNDKVTFPPPDRPNIHMTEFIEAVHCHAGAAFGMARAYSLMRADSSYTAFRGDMIMTWQGAFYPMQKWLERDFADKVAVKVLKWAQRKRINGKPILKPLAAGWERTLSWKWPTMPEVNIVDAATAMALNLKNGSTDYSDILGPDWRKRLEKLSEQIEVIRSLGLPLSVLEMKSGGSASGANEADKPKGKDNEQDSDSRRNSSK